jgi:hypothetical protein
MKPRKLFQKAVRSPQNLRFQDFLTLASAFGFRVARISGSHHILVHDSVDEQLNLQDTDGQAKPYQVRQFLKLVEENDLALDDQT